jgi:histidinol dehydrogenase
MEVESNGLVALDEYQTTLDDVEAEVISITKQTIGVTLESLPAFEKAKLQTVLAYALTTLQICYARIRGEGITDHPCMGQLNRLRCLFQRLDNYRGEVAD